MNSHSSNTLAAIRGVVSRHLRVAAEIDDDTPLVSAGLIDSLAIVELVLDLEDELGVHIPAGRVQADDLDSINLIAETAARFG